MNQVLKEATCRIPQKRCQLVQQDPSKIYTPHCTILHRCSEDSGCCPSRSQICAAKSTHNVELHFFVSSEYNNTDLFSIINGFIVIYIKYLSSSWLTIIMLYRILLITQSSLSHFTLDHALVPLKIICIEMLRLAAAKATTIINEKRFSF